MNTYRIYEDLKATLGDAAAQSLAKMLGTMFEELKDTVTKEDFRILRESVDANVSRLEAAITRLAEAQARTEQQGQSLAEAQARTDQQLKSLAEAQARTEQQVKSLAEAQARTEQQVKSLAEAQARTEQQVASLAEAMRRLTIRTDAVVGRTFELQFRDRLTSYLGRFLRRGKVVSNDSLLDAIETSVTADEVDDFLRADIVAKGFVDGVENYVVVEVSSTGDTADIVRANARAGILRKAGLAAIPLLACDVISPESQAFANRLGVRVWCNGSLVDAAA
jgi:DNA repair exonuclease SbcCD ATPase subunit